MKTKDAIELFKGASRLARLLGITRSAISQWGEDVPRLREYEIKELVEAGAHVASEKQMEA